jgi:hypothetical protein
MKREAVNVVVKVDGKGAAFFVWESILKCFTVMGCEMKLKGSSVHCGGCLNSIGRFH